MSKLCSAFIIERSSWSAPKQSQSELTVTVQTASRDWSLSSCVSLFYSVVWADAQSLPMLCNIELFCFLNSSYKKISVMYNTLRLLNALREQYVFVAVYFVYIFFKWKSRRSINWGYNYSFNSFQLWNETMVSCISELSSKMLTAAHSLVWDPDKFSYRSTRQS